MHFVAWFDLLTAIAGAVAAVCVIRGRKRPGFLPVFPILLLILLVLRMLCGAANFLEWASVTLIFEWLEDFGSLFVPFVWAFLFYAIAQKAAEYQREKLMRQLQFTQFGLDHAGEAAVWVDHDENLVYVNQKFCQLHGYTRDELAQMTLRDIDPFYTTEIWNADWDKLRKDGTRQFQGHHRRKDGTVFPVEITSRFMTYQGNEYICSFERDITELKAAEQEREELMRQLQFTQFALDHAGEAAHWVTRDETFVYVNEMACQMLGYTHDELMGLSVPDIDPHYPPDAWGVFWDELRQERTRRFEGRHKRKDGTVFPVEITSNFVTYEDKEYICSFMRDITERKQMEKALIMREREFRTLAENSPDNIARYDTDCRTVYVNPTLEKTLGRPASELLGPTPKEAALIGGFREYHEKVAEVLKTGKEAEIDLFMPDSGERERYHNVRFVAERGADGAITGVLAIGRDITERKENERALDESRRAMTALIGNLPGVAYRCLNMPDWPMEFLSKGCFEMTGYTDQEILSQQVLWNDLIVPEDRARVWDEIQKALQHHANYQLEYRIRSKDGALKHLWEKGCGILDAAGQMLAIEGFITDITDRQKAKEALIFTQFATDHAGEAAYWMGPDAEFIYVNDAACRALGYSKDQLLTMSVQDIDPDFPADIWPQHWQEVKEKRSMRFESHHKTKDGRIFPVEVTTNFLEYAGREYNCAFVRDITERKQAEEALQESETKHRMIFTSASDAIFILDGDRFVECNPQAVKLFGYEDASEIISKTPADFSPVYQEDGRLSSEAVQEMSALVLQGKPQRFPWVHRKKDRSFIYTEVSLNPIQLKGKMYIQAMVRDVTQQRLAEIEQERLLRELRSKNEELESIVFIASHDLRSPLVNIRGFTGELEKSLDRLQHLLADENLTESTQKRLEDLFGADIPESLSFIKAGNQKMDVLLNGLLRLSRVGTTQVYPTKLDMDQMFKGIVNNFHFRVRREEIEITVDKPLPACRGDVVLVNQVFTNLIDNAIKYRHHSRKAEIHVSAEVKPEGVVYRVADNGIGIAPEHINKVFEVFHRLNPGEDEGDGLGLTIVARILDRQQGQVWIESEPGVGTSVYVLLPNA